MHDTIRMKNFLQRRKLIILGTLLGGVAGYLYYYFVGCASGSCAITSSPVNSTIYGSLMGGLAFNIFQKEQSKTESDEH